MFAARLMEHKGVDHVPYRLTWIENTPYSVCPDFVTVDTELVSAHHIRKTASPLQGESKLEHFLRCCALLGIPGMQPQLDRMMTVDYLIANEDRHMNNFGALRNANTLELIGPAPIFDCGTSLWYDNLFRWAGPEDDCPSKPFADRHSEQIQLVHSFDWLDMKSINGATDELYDVLSAAPAYMDENRIDTLTAAFDRRVQQLLELVQEPRMDMRME